MKRLIVLFTLLFAPTAYSSDVPPCRFENPWMVSRGVASDEVEYKYNESYKNLYLPFEVKLQTGSGVNTCMMRLQDGVSLVVPKKFNTESENPSVSLMGKSWVKVNSTSYPIISPYNLAVVKMPEEKIILVSQQNAEYHYRQPLLLGTNEPKEKEESRCGGWCIAGLVALGAVVGGIVVKNNGSDKQPAPATGHPPTGTADPAF